MRRTHLFLALLALALPGCRDSFIGPEVLPKATTDRRVYFSGVEPAHAGGDPFGYVIGSVASISSDGSDRKDIVNTHGMLLSAPKNGRIAYYELVDFRFDFGQAVVAEADGSGLRVIAQGVRGKSLVLAPVVLSPDGGMVTYVLRDLVTPGTFLCIADVNGALLSKVPIECGCDIYSLKFSPNGRYIAYVGNDDPSKKIHVVNVLTGSTFSIGQNVGASISWSPDGKSMAYSEENNRYYTHFPYLPNADLIHSSAISIVDLSGKNIRRVMRDTAELFDVSWAPNASMLAYVRRVGTASNLVTEIWLTNINGITRRQLTASTDRADLRPQWTSDGLSLVFTSIPTQEESEQMPQVRRYDMLTSTISTIADRAYGAILE